VPASSSAAFQRTETSALHAAQPHLFDKLFLPANPPELASKIFLNCTKNTELTPHPFARTFVIALNQKVSLTLPETVTGMN
jgi:hypothetical protein